MELNSLMPWNRKAELPRGTDSHPVASFQREMDRLFDEFWRRWELGFADDERLPWVPQADVFEDDKTIEIALELPGLDDKDIEVKVEGDRLIVEGEKRQTHRQEHDERGWLVSERRWGKFQRVMPLPPHIDRDKIAASFDNGVLTLSLPKTEEGRREARHIEVRKASQKKAA